MIARAGPPSVHALGLAGTALGLLCAAAVLTLDAPPLSLLVCPLRAATGIPCLACGCTHAFHFAVRGQAGAAFSSSPLGALLALTCALHVLWTLLRLAGMPWAPQVQARTLRFTALAALGANWVFLVCH